jgi:sulfatase maturation enzyme AslB (radical SAM superfamily)
MSKPRVLIVEDNVDNYELVRFLLERAGYQVLSAANGIEGVDAAKREVAKRELDVALASWYGEPAGLCIHSPTCGTALAMEHNGDMYSCDHFVEHAPLRFHVARRRNEDAEDADVFRL